MPRQSKNIEQPATSSGEASESTPTASGGRKRAGKDETHEETLPSGAPAAGDPAGGTGAEARGAPPGPAPAGWDAGGTSGPAPAGQETGGTPPGPAPLAGLRGEGYVKALKGHPVATLEVPLLPQERRGDWERARGQKIPVTARQFNSGPAHWLDRDHALSALVIELQRPGVTRFDQIDLHGSSIKEAIERLSDYTNQARLHAQAQTGKKWTASQVYLIPVEDA